ncbi:MAG TPA: HipA domain-containing protein [Trueperaceae bacterium]|nr:HipA domain-containing protein [Trueperaceae bacterium]
MLRHEADVYKAGTHAATLLGTRGTVEFRYLAAYLEQGLPPVATTLPLNPEPVVNHGGAVPPFFAGLLPEGRRLTTLRRHLKASMDDELSLLLAVGSDTVGDVQIMPKGAPPVRSEPLLQLPKDMSSISFAEQLRDHQLIDPVGLPGVQEKASGRMINLPASRAYERFVVKLAPPEYPGVIENEAFFLGLAKKAGLRTVKWQVAEDRDGVRALLVTRFDRAIGGQAAVALACEDACQVLGLWPASKYSVTMEEAAGALTRWCAAPAVAARDIFSQVVFAVLTGNGDLHAKNISILATPTGEWRISPAYDLPSTVAYGDHTFALPIRESTQPYSRRSLLEFAAEIGLRRPAAEKIIDRLIERTQRPLTDLVAAGLPYNLETVSSMISTYNYRRRQLSA